MENKASEKIEIIKCPHCKLPLMRQIKNKTVKRVEIIYRNKGTVGSIVIDIENKKLPLRITCPRCKTSMPLTFMVGELTGITFSFKGESSEIIGGRSKRITNRDERKLRKIYLKLKTLQRYPRGG